MFLGIYLPHVLWLVFLLTLRSHFLKRIGLVNDLRNFPASRYMVGILVDFAFPFSQADWIGECPSEFTCLAFYGWYFY
jgi:hypothetical protein